MRRSREQIYRGYEINTGKFNSSSYYPKIVDRIIDQITNLLDRHSRITVLRIDPKLPDIPGISKTHKNSMLSTFVDKVKKQLSLSKWGSKEHVAHGWVMEIGESGLPHYHLFFAFETSFRHLGSFNPEKPTGFWKFLVDCARDTFNGSLHYSNHYAVNRSNPTEVKNCIKHLSYFAKVWTKDFGTHETHKRFGFSQIKPLQNTPAQKAAKYAAQQARAATRSYPLGHTKKKRLRRTTDRLKATKKPRTAGLFI